MTQPFKQTKPAVTVSWLKAVHPGAHRLFPCRAPWLPTLEALRKHMTVSKTSLPALISAASKIQSLCKEPHASSSVSRAASSGQGRGPGQQILPCEGQHQETEHKPHCSCGDRKSPSTKAMLLSHFKSLSFHFAEVEDSDRQNSFLNHSGLA